MDLELPGTIVPECTFLFILSISIVINRWYSRSRMSNYTKENMIVDLFIISTLEQGSTAVIFR